MKKIEHSLTKLLEGNEPVEYKDYIDGESKITKVPHYKVGKDFFIPLNVLMMIDKQLNFMYVYDYCEMEYLEHLNLRG